MWGGDPLSNVDPEGLRVPGSWQTIFGGTPNVQLPRSEPETPAMRECINNFIKNTYGPAGAIVPSFSAYSYLPNSANFSAAVQSTVISGGAKGVAIPTLIRGGQAAQAVGSAIAPWVSGAGALQAGGVAATALGTAGLWGATAVGGFGLPFSTTAEYMARRECSCQR